MMPKIAIVAENATFNHILWQMPQGYLRVLTLVCYAERNCNQKKKKKKKNAKS